MPQLGIIGFERGGKTSLFNAVANAQHAMGFQTHSDPHLGVVQVPDDRLPKLSALYAPKKTTPATLEYVDFPGAGFGGGEGPAVRFLDQLSQMDAFIHVVRLFDNEAVPHPSESIDATRDIESMTLELTFADLGLIEKRLTRIAEETKSMKAAERTLAERETELLGRLQEALSDGVPLRAVALSDEERKSLRQYRFLTERPLLTVLNIGEGDAGRAGEIAAAYPAPAGAPGAETVALCASLEAELRSLSEEEAAEYRAELGASAGAMQLAVQLSYAALGLRSFFTVGEDECRAWTIRAGENAQEAAGKIHSDLERGFIRAEVVSWQDLLDAGSEAEAKKRAMSHTEGKDYLVQDGDVVHVLFNV